MSAESVEAWMRARGAHHPNLEIDVDESGTWQALMSLGGAALTIGRGPSLDDALAQLRSRLP